MRGLVWYSESAFRNVYFLTSSLDADDQIKMDLQFARFGEVQSLKDYKFSL